MLSVIILTSVVLSVIILSDIVLSVIVLSVIMLSVIMVTDVILSAVASLHKASVVRIDPDDKLKKLGRFLQQKMSMSNIVEVTIER